MKLSGVQPLSSIKMLQDDIFIPQWAYKGTVSSMHVMSPMCVCMCLEIFYFFEISESGIEMFKRIETIVLVLVLKIASYLCKILEYAS